MARITQLLDAGPTLSFEFSAPRDEAGAQRLSQTLARLSRHQPHFMSVTYGAGGTTRGPTRDWVRTIRDDFRVEAMPHLTCVAHTQDEIAEIISDYESDGIENILALRGDLPQDAESPTQAFETAAELTQFIRERADWDIAVAAHPEGHPMAASVEADLKHQSAKLAQADFALTQFGYRAQYYEQFVNQLDARGVKHAGHPRDHAADQRRRDRAHVRAQRDRVPNRDPGTACASVNLCRAAGNRRRGRGRSWQRTAGTGSPGLHIYTMNFSRAASEVASALGWPAD